MPVVSTENVSMFIPLILWSSVSGSGDHMQVHIHVRNTEKFIDDVQWTILERKENSILRKSLAY